MMTNDHNAADTESIGPMELEEYTGILREIEEQPRWRANADKEMDYVDGNQPVSARMAGPIRSSMAGGMPMACWRRSNSLSSWLPST